MGGGDGGDGGDDVAADHDDNAQGGSTLRLQRQRQLDRLARAQRRPKSAFAWHGGGGVGDGGVDILLASPQALTRRRVAAQRQEQIRELSAYRGHAGVWA